MKPDEPNPVKKWHYVAVVVVTSFFCYFFSAVTTFQLRHPWATQQEIANHLGEALRFERVSYEKVRAEYR